MLPGKIFKDLDTKRIQIIELFIGDAIAHGLDIALFKAHEKHVENGGNNMEVLAQRQKAQEKEKGQVMDKIGDQMRILQCRQRGTAQHMAKQPAQAQRGRKVDRHTCLSLCRYQTGFKQAFRNHQSRYQTENKYGFSGMIFSVPRRHGISRGLKNPPADGGDNTDN